MGINISNLDDSLQPVGASLLSGNESIMDNLRELSDEELKTSGGSKGGNFFFSGGGGFGGSSFFSGGGKKGGSVFIQQPQQFTQPVATQPVFTQPVATQSVFTQPVATQPVATTTAPVSFGSGINTGGSVFFSGGGKKGGGFFGF